jgi:phage-Barnase-EndoU-ColicinE5/D-RelE like nuclease3
VTGTPLAPLFSAPVTRNEALWARGLDAYPISLGQTLGATAEESWIRNPGPSIVRLMGRGRYAETVGDEFGGEIPNPTRREATMLSPDDANARYGIQGHLKFDGETPEPVAAELNALKRDELDRKDRMARGPSGAGAFAAQLATGFAVSIVDPINIGSAFVPVVGQARFALWAERIGTTGARAARGAIEGAAGAALVEPIVLGAAWAEQAEYGAADSLLNLAFGTALGGGLHVGLGALGDRFGRAALETREAQARAAVGDLVAQGGVDRAARVLALDAARAASVAADAPAGERVADLWRRVAARDPDAPARVDLDAVGPEEAAKLEAAFRRAGIAGDARAFRHIVEGDALRHVLREHGNAGEYARGQRPVTEADIARLPEVFARPDRIEPGGVTGNGMRAMIYEKRIGDEFVVVETVRGRRRELGLHSMWIKTGMQAVPDRRSIEAAAAAAPDRNARSERSNTEAVVPEAPPEIQGPSKIHRNVPGSPPSLVQALIRAGGISDARGDIVVDRKAWKTLLAKKNKGGQPLDRLAQAMREAGYLDFAKGDTDEARLRWAIDQELSGKPQYAAADAERAQARADALAFNEEIDRLAADYGVSPAGLTEDQFFARVVSSERMTAERAAAEAARQADAIEADYARLAQARREFLESRGEAWEPDIRIADADPANPNWEIDLDAKLRGEAGLRQSLEGRGGDAGAPRSDTGTADGVPADRGPGRDGPGAGDARAEQGPAPGRDTTGGSFEDPELSDLLARAEADLDALLRAGLPAGDPAVTAAQALVKDAETQGRALDAAAFCLGRNA